MVVRNGLAFLAAASADVNWREQLVPSFEADHEGMNWDAPGAASFRNVTEALHRVQAENGINESLLSSLPFLPKVETLNVTMSDGVEIWTRVVNPWPWNSKKPACLVRSPYGSMATQNLALVYMILNGHAAVMQETRGTWSSGGEFDMWRNSNQDALDTMEWVAAQDWSDGEVYSMGASADGIDAIEEVLHPPKRLHGEWLIWTTGNGHHFVYPGGAYRKDLMEGYFGMLSPITRGASTQKVLPATQEHEAMGPWWYNLTDCSDPADPSIAPGCRYSNVKWPTVMSAGWWDLFHGTMLDAWTGLRARSHETVREDHVLIVGPLGHAIAGKMATSTLESTRHMVAEADGLVVAAELTSEFWRWSKCSNEWTVLSPNQCKCNGRVRFGKGDTWSEPKLVTGSIRCDTNNFEDPLPWKAKECQCQEATGTLRERIGRVNLFIMGSFGSEIPLGAGNYWTSLEDFPTFDATAVYLSSGSSLTHSAPTQTGQSSYSYDPKDPAPMIGGNNLPAIGSIEFVGSANQVPRESRSDVIFFDGPALPADLPIVGPVSARLFVTSSAVDTDFFVTLDDLHPDGSKAMLVRYGMLRMRWRDSEITKSEPLVDSEVYEVVVNLGYTGYIFPKGHKLRVSVSSAAAPYFVPTSNTGRNDMTEKGDGVVAENTVHFSPEHPSSIILPVVSADAIPENPHFTGIGPFLQNNAGEQSLLV